MQKRQGVSAQIPTHTPVPGRIRANDKPDEFRNKVRRGTNPGSSWPPPSRSYHVMLNVSVGKGFESISALWGQFSELAKMDTQPDMNESTEPDAPMSPK